MSTEIIVRQATNDDLDTIGQIMAAGFGGDASQWRANLEGNPRYGVNNMVIAEIDGQPVGNATSFSTQMWLSGVPLQMGAVADVVTLPAFQNQGVASTMMQHLLQKMADQGMAISVLFPASYGIYSRCGYADAAVWHAYSIEPNNVIITSEAEQVRPFVDDDLATIRSLYRGSQLSQADGRLTRSNAWWDSLVTLPHRTGPNHIVVYDGDMGMEGYLKYSLTEDKGLKVREMFVHSDAAYRGLWSHLAGQPDVTRIEYLASADDPILHLLKEPRDSAGGNRGWIFNDIYHATSATMLRIIDLSEALTSRFYPHNMMGNRVIQLSDPNLSANQELINFRIVDGRPDIIPVEGQPPQIESDVATFSQVFCGFLSPEMARRLGKLQADDDTIEWLSKAMATKPLFIHADDWF